MAPFQALTLLRSLQHVASRISLNVSIPVYKKDKREPRSMSGRSCRPGLYVKILHPLTLHCREQNHVGNVIWLQGCLGNVTPEREPVWGQLVVFVLSTERGTFWPPICLSCLISPSVQNFGEARYNLRTEKTQQKLRWQRTSMFIWAYSQRHLLEWWRKLGQVWKRER